MTLYRATHAYRTSIAAGSHLPDGTVVNRDYSIRVNAGDLLDETHIAVAIAPENFVADDEAERAQRRADLERAANNPHAQERVNLAPPASTRDAETSSGPYGRTRDLARRTLDAAHDAGHLADEAAERAARLVNDGPDFGRFVASRWAVVTGDPDYRTAFAKKCADPEGARDLWTDAERSAWQRVAAFQSEQRAMGLGDAAGGFMVPLTLDPAILLTSAGSINPLRRISRVVQTVTNTWQGVSSAGATAEWKAEADQVADGSPTLGDEPIPVHFGDSFVPYSFEVGQDASNFLGELQRVLVDAADQLMATAYTTGSGTGQPKGIITALAGSASEVNAAADDVFAAADVYGLQTALPARFSPNAQWMAHLAVINAMAQMETTNGARLFPELGEGRLLNRPMNENSNMDSSITTSGAVSNYALAYGDFSNFVIVDRIGTTLELIPNLVGANGRPTGQRGALLWFRTGSDAVVANAFRLLDVASAA